MDYTRSTAFAVPGIEHSLGLLGASAMVGPGFSRSVSTASNAGYYILIYSFASGLLRAHSQHKTQVAMGASAALSSGF